MPPSYTEIYSSQNVTFSNDTDKLVTNESQFLKECTNAIQELHGVYHVECTNVYLGSIVTLEGPENEVDKALDIISSIFLMLELIKSGPQTTDDLESKETNFGTENGYILITGSILVLTVLILVLGKKCSYFCGCCRIKPSRKNTFDVNQVDIGKLDNTFDKNRVEIDIEKLESIECSGSGISLSKRGPVTSIQIIESNEAHISNEVIMVETPTSANSFE